MTDANNPGLTRVSTRASDSAVDFDSTWRPWLRCRHGRPGVTNAWRVTA